MNKKKESKVVPNVRFKGFTDDWKQRKLGDVGSVSMCRRIFKEQTSESGDIPFYKIGTFGGEADAFISRELFEEYKAKYPYPKKGDILISASGSIGRTVEFTGENEYFQDSNIVWLNHDERLDNSFLKCFYSVVKWAGIEGSTIKRLYNDNILNTTITLPSVAEQKKIGEYFSIIDHLITLSQRKIDKLKNLKKSMLEKMFPKKGTVSPEIRFNGFTNAWKQRKVLDLLIQPITDGPHETPKLVEEGVPFISVDAIVDNKIDFNRKRGNISEEYDELCCKKYKPQFHDVYLVKSGSTVGKVAIVETTDRFNIWSPLAAMRCGEKTYPYFLYDLLQTKDLQAQVADKASNGTQPNLSMRELEKFPVSVPSNLEEQKKIGDYFRNLDHLIILHQRKLDMLKKLKSACLSEMFI